MPRSGRVAAPARLVGWHRQQGHREWLRTRRCSTLAGLKDLADSMAYQSANDLERDPQRAREHAFTNNPDRCTERERCEYDKDGAIALH